MAPESDRAGEVAAPLAQPALLHDTRHAPLVTAFLDGFGQARFRGGVLGTIKSAPMGAGHKNDGRPLDIETACFLKPVFAAYDRARSNGTRLKLTVKAGVKTLKSLTGEAMAGDHVSHASGDAAIFFATGETADVGATTRILKYLKGIPHFRAKLETMLSRFDDTNGMQKFPDKTLFILAANMSNTQQKNLAFVMLQDAFLTEATGMIGEMIARTTSYKKEAIVVIESQGGEKGYDFDRQYEESDQGELHVNCPCCGTSHLWNWKAWDMERDERFQAILPIARVKEIEDRVRAWNEKFKIQNSKLSLDGLAEDNASAPVSSPVASGAATTWHPSPWAIEHRIAWELIVAREELTELLKSQDHRKCGFKRGPDELIKLPGGGYNKAAILRETHFECFHCGGIWRDDGEFGSTRIALDRSSHYVTTNPNALAGDMGFNIPQWIVRRNSWGEIMLEKLLAQKTADELGNFNDLKIWWQKVAARTWDKELSAKMPERIAASIYDTKPGEGERVRISATDIQFDLTWMVYEAWAIMSEGVGPRLLHFEYVLPPKDKATDQEKREWCKNRVRALDKEFGIEVQNSMKDAAHRPDLVREWAAEDAVIISRVKGFIRDTKVYTYGLLLGDDRLSFKWRHKGRKPTWERFAQERNYTNHEVVMVERSAGVWGRPEPVPIKHEKLEIKNEGTADPIQNEQLKMQNVGTPPPVPKKFNIKVGARQWSNFSIKEIAARWRDGDSAPKIQVHEKFLADTSKEGFDAGMRSEVKLPWKNHPGRERYDNQSRPNHPWDCFCMVMVRMDELNYLNSFGAPQAEEGEGN